MGITEKDIENIQDKLAVDTFPMWSAFKLGISEGKQMGAISGFLSGIIASTLVYWLVSLF